MSLLLTLMIYILLSYPVVFFCIRMWTEEITCGEPAFAGLLIILSPISLAGIAIGTVLMLSITVFSYLCEIIGDFVLYWRR